MHTVKWTWVTRALPLTKNSLGPYLNFRLKMMNSRLCLHRPFFKFKLILYESVISPVWSYGVRLWEPEKSSNTRAFPESIDLPAITSAPQYITNINSYIDSKNTRT